MATKRHRIKIISLYILIIAIFICGLSACKKSSQLPVTQTGFYFDTVITVTIYEGGTDATLTSCFELANYYESLFSRTLEGSDIYRINHANGAPTEVSPETITLLATALKFAKLSDGAVDPTIGAITSLWDFHEDSTHIPPDSNAIADALKDVDYTTVQINEYTVTLANPQTILDLGFIAKGYIADKIKDFLIKEGVTSALINLGGNILAVGSKPDSSAFNIGIQKPFADAGIPITTASVKDSSVVSSGIYERYYEYNGNLYHHILDTRTGYPVQNDLHSVSILSPNSVDGDALSTICLVLGYEKAYELVLSLENVDAIFITEDGQIHTTF